MLTICSSAITFQRTTIDIIFTVNSGVSGTIENTAEITDAEDENGDHPTDEDSQPDDDNTNDGPINDDEIFNEDGDEDDHDIAEVEVGEFDLALTKVLNTAGPFAPGDAISYTIEVTNQGSIDAFNIEVVDYIPTGLILSGLNWTDTGAGLVTLNNPIGFLAAGSSISVSISFIIDPDFMGTSIENFAEITDPTNDGPEDVDSTPDTDDSNDGPSEDNDTNNTNGDEDDHDPEVFEVEQTFDLALIKQVLILK